MPQPNCVLVGDTTHTPCFRYIRASVDALCRDGAGEMSRDPGTKASKTRRERLAMPSKYPKDHSRGPYLLIHMPKCILCPCKSYYRNPLIRDFTIFVSSSSSFFRPDFSLPEQVEALIFSLNVPRYGGGVHRRQAMFVFLLPIATEDLEYNICSQKTTPFSRSSQTPPTPASCARRGIRPRGRSSARSFSSRLVV